ncbi:MAG: MarR family winged helix-turn-helix transcriptional regulator [Dorea sp.]|nr:MarR family winged helix-turn-helix transcriptional regulator [Dorea sp.]
MDRNHLKRLLDSCYTGKRIVETLPDLPSRMKPGHIHVMETIYEILEQKGTCRVGEVSAGMGITTPSITRLIKELELLKMVEKYADPLDKRVALVRLTKGGQECVQIYVLELHSRWAEAMGDITEEQVDMVCEIIERLRDTMPGKKERKGDRYDKR